MYNLTLIYADTYEMDTIDIPSEDDDNINPPYIEITKIKTNKKKAGRPRKETVQTHNEISKLSASILEKLNNNICSLQITNDLTQELINFDDVKLTTYLSYIECQNMNTTTLHNDISILVNSRECHLIDIKNMSTNSTLNDKKTHLNTAKQELETQLKIVKQCTDRVKLLEYYIKNQEESQNPLRLLQVLITSIKYNRSLMSANNFVFAA